MPPGRSILSVMRIAGLLALAAGVAAIGWFVGRFLPLANSSSPAQQPAAPPESLPEVETPLAEQMAEIERRTSATIHLESRPLDRGELTALSRLENLQVLLLDHGDNAIGDEDCQMLAGLDNLVHLRIRGGAIGDAGLAHLVKLPQLKILNLPQCRVTDRGLAILATAPKLAQLRLGSRQISDAAVPALARFPALRQLHLIEAPISDAGLEQIAQLPKLQSLYLDGSGVTDAGLDRLFQARPELHFHINQRHHDRDPRRGHVEMPNVESQMTKGMTKAE